MDIARRTHQPLNPKANCVPRAKPPKKPLACPEDKSSCDCITTCPEELRVDCAEKGDPNRCCQGCMATEAEDEGSDG